MESNVANLTELINSSAKPTNVIMSNVIPSDEIADMVDMNSANLMDAYFAIIEVNTEPEVLKAMVKGCLQSDKNTSLNTVVDDILYEIEDMLQELRYSIEDAADEVRLENNKVNNLKGDEYGK